MLLSTLKMQPRVKHLFRFLAIAAATLVTSACIYRVDIQQGNLLESDAVEQVELGMTRSQVQFLLGTPMVADAFHQDRWDYAYFLRRGRSRDVERRWIAVYFEEDRVVGILGDLTPDALDPP